MATVQIKRIYDPVETTDGARILIDRLWPRGVKKESARLDEWMKAISPSVTLRKWFDHDPAKWEEFKAKYTFELKQNKAVDDLLNIIQKNKTVTLLYAAHDAQYNHAIVLLQFINALLK
ncbi:MAG TPA: DUF488 domain-containing protein [Mucilaginibacter sp.]|nr:DUF488 domain-containing protein [Mucilaginibacter sp.]